VQITMAEKFGIEGGSVLRRTGAIRDVVENHMLQVVAFLAMEPPTGLHCDAIRDEQVKVSAPFHRWTKASGARQFNGYKKEKGVAPESKVETFAAVRLEFSHAVVRCPVSDSRRKVPASYNDGSTGQTQKPPLDILGDKSSNLFRFRLGPEKFLFASVPE